VFFKSSSVFKIHWFALYLKLIVLLPLPVYSTDVPSFQLKKKTILNWQPLLTKPWPLDLQFICFPYSRRIYNPVLFILYVSRISCFCSGFLLKVLVYVPFVLPLLLFGIHYLILSGLLLCLPLNELLKIIIQSSFQPPPLLAACTLVSDSTLDTGAL